MRPASHGAPSAPRVPVDGGTPGRDDPGLFVPRRRDAGTKAFVDTRYVDCGGSEVYARFVNPTNLGDPGAFSSVTMRASGKTGSVNAGYWGAPHYDWGGNLNGLGVTNVRDHDISWSASYPGGAWGTTAYVTLYRGCNWVGF